ncbi:hypothetical protein [Sphingomonas sanxanigenens]|nr:hypothetical protein [Sphingomonas sanxanigenens]
MRMSYVVAAGAAAVVLAATVPSKPEAAPAKRGEPVSARNS